MNQKLATEDISILEDGLALKFLIHPPKIKTSKQKAIVLLHGVGSNEEDLFSLAEYLPVDFWIISPRGYYTLGAGRYAWYEVDFSSGTPEINSTQEETSRKIIIQFIEQLKSKYQIEDIYLGGFSQGAIMSYSIGLAAPKIVKGIMALSGRILHEIRPLVVNNSYLQQLKITCCAINRC
jgi:phospholipase/carboxylesterase